VRGIRVRGAKGKTEYKVYTQVVKNCSMSELMPIIKGKADTDAVYIPMDLRPMTDWLITGIKNILE